MEPSNDRDLCNTNVVYSMRVYLRFQVTGCNIHWREMYTNQCYIAKYHSTIYLYLYIYFFHILILSVTKFFTRSI